MILSMISTIIHLYPILSNSIIQRADMNCHQPTHRSFETAYVPKCHGLSLFIYIKRPHKFNLLGVGRGQCHPSASLLCIPFDVPPKALDLWQRAVPPQHPHWENQGFPSAQSPRHVKSHGKGSEFWAKAFMSMKSECNMIQSLSTMM